MSEQALRAAPSGTGLTTVGSTTGRFTTPPGGKSGSATGNDLPVKGSSPPDLQKLATELNDVSRVIGRELHFEVDLEGGNAVIQVLDRETGEVIRQIPSEEASSVLRRNGVVQIQLFDERV